MNTIFCVCSYPGVAPVAPCRQRGVHLETCLDEACHGCYLRAAVRGFLCPSHYDRLQHAYTRWSDFEGKVAGLGLSKAVQRDNAGICTRQGGYVNLTGVFLTVDECHRHLLSLAGFGSIDMWISTERGATDAMLFAACAERAYRSHEIQERPHRIIRFRCPECQQHMIWHPPAWYDGHVTVRCSNNQCGHVIDQGEFEEREKTA